MKLLSKLRQILTIRVPNWIGFLCYSVLVILILVLIFVLAFPGQVDNFLIEHDTKFLQ
jgi:uncharacterized protein involved in cysteine biosynthesis